MDSSNTTAGAVASSDDVSDSNVTSDDGNVASHTAAGTVASANVVSDDSDMSVTTTGSDVMSHGNVSVDGGNSVSASTVHNVVHSCDVADNVNSWGTLVHSNVVVHSCDVVDSWAVASVHSNVVHSRGAVSWGRIGSWGTSSSGWS